METLNSWDPRLGGVYLVLGVHERLSLAFPHHRLSSTPELVSIEDGFKNRYGVVDADFVVTGVVFRLVDAGEVALKPLAPLLSGFAEFSADGDERPARDADPRVRVLCGAAEIAAEQVRRLIAEYLSIPPLDTGMPTCVHGPVSDPRIFNSWPVWNPQGPPSRFDDRLVDQLTAVVADKRQSLRVFLLWNPAE